MDEGYINSTSGPDGSVTDSLDQDALLHLLSVTSTTHDNSSFQPDMNGEVEGSAAMAYIDPFNSANGSLQTVSSIKIHFEMLEESCINSISIPDSSATYNLDQDSLLHLRVSITSTTVDKPIILA